ncbi:hypothetical protein AB0896_27400 [Streptomyces parvulus]|uniref:hypothetical protein n=1 Tax=Streptomyces parvulus TaxID=146923 RepID=UPI00345236C0
MTKSTGPACGNNPNYRMSEGDRLVVEDFKAYLADRTILRDRIAEAIRQSDFREWPLRRSVTAADAVLALLAPNPPEGLGDAPSYVGPDANKQPARADLLNTFASWLFTTGRGSRQAADRILGKHRAEVLREAADRYASLTDQNEAYDREHGELDEEARLRHGTVRDVATGLRRMADETAATETSGKTSSQEQQDDVWPVKDATRRYAEQLRSQPGAAVADGHTGWECDAGASLLVGAETPGPGKLGTHHATIYACTVHRATAAVRIMGAGYEADPRPAPPGHRWNPWPCGHVTAHSAAALSALTVTDEPAAGTRQDGARS